MLSYLPCIIGLRNTDVYIEHGLKQANSPAFWMLHGLMQNNLKVLTLINTQVFFVNMHLRK